MAFTEWIFYLVVVRLKFYSAKQNTQPASGRDKYFQGFASLLTILK